MPIFSWRADDSTPRPAPFTECCGTCVDLLTNASHCGACDNPCEAGQCILGSCGDVCMAPMTDCSGVCVSTATDSQNCGACGNACAPGELCIAGTCQVVVNTQKDSSGKGKLLKECFPYDRERDLYICPLTGEELMFWRIDKSGVSYPRRTYRCKRKDCPHRDACTKDRSMGRTIKRSPHDDALERHKQRLELDGAKIAIDLRKQVVEHVFGNIKFGDGMRRFTAQGLEGARAQWALACTAFNLRKLHTAWRHGQFALTP